MRRSYQLLVGSAASVESMAKKSESGCDAGRLCADLLKRPEVAKILKQAYIFGQELEEAGAVKNVKTVLSEYKQMGKGVSDDEGFRYNAESALVFYRTKSYDVLTAVRLQS